MRVCLTLFCLWCGQVAWAQSSSYMAYDADLYNWIDRAAILTGGKAAQRLGSVRPYLRADVAALADSLAKDSALLTSPREAATHKFLVADNSEFFAEKVTRRKPVLGGLFRNEADVYAVRTKDFDLHISPSFHGMLGQDRGDVARNLYINTRGVEVRGTVDKRVSFYTYLADNQAIMPYYVQQYADRLDSLHPSLPYEAYVKPDVFGRPRRGYYDFITARGHIAFQATRHIAVSFGQDRHFVGDGMRSLIWSDWAPANPYLKLETNVWRIRYTNIFSQMKAGTREVADRFVPNKWLAFHQLDIDLTDKLKFGVFESVVFAPSDTNKRGFFDLSYLNPIIFYRFVEQYNGSADNSLVGANLRWDLFRQVRLYGQLVFDELRIRDLAAQNGWWGNKYAIQAGAKWINPLKISGLDLQAEYNLVRPFTYTHQDQFRNNTHYGLPLAHPAGANFTEFMGRATYQITPRLRLMARAMLLRQGLDTRTDNFGQEIRRNYLQRAREFGNELAQGLPSRTLQAECLLSYMPWHRVFLDVGLLVREQSAPDVPVLNQRTQMLSFAVRWNIARREMWF